MTITAEEFNKLNAEYPNSCVTFDKVRHLSMDESEMAMCNLHYRWTEASERINKLNNRNY